MTKRLLNVKATARRGTREAKARPESRRARQWVCLVAEDASSGELLGHASVQITKPEALLPSPFPTRAVDRFYLASA